MTMEGKRRLTIKTSEDMEKDKEKEMAKKLDLSGMSLDSLPNPSINLGLITKVDLSNNNLGVISNFKSVPNILYEIYTYLWVIFSGFFSYFFPP